MQLNVIAMTGKASSAVDVNEAVFSCEFNEPLVHQVVVAYLAKARAGTHKQKTRSEVRGGGAKPWRQKGTGRARHGSIRSPLWRGGGVTFAAVPRDYSQKVNKKMYRAAMRSILSELSRQEKLIIIDDIVTKAPKTKEMVALLKHLKLTNVLIVKSEVDENTYLAARNLPMVMICDAAGVNPVDLIKYESVLITVSALKQIEELLA